MGWRQCFLEVQADRGFKLPWLAKKTGIKVGTLRNWFSREGGNPPPLPDAIKIAEALGKSLDEVFRGIPPDHPLLEEVERLLFAERESGRAEGLAEADEKDKQARARQSSG